MKFFLPGLASILIIGCISGGNDTRSGSDIVNAKLSNIQLVDLEDNKIDWADFKGKAVFLNFWATWCRPCIAEMPSIETAIKHFETGEVAFLLATEEGAEKIQRFNQQYAFNLPFVRQETGLASLGIVAIPTTYIFNKNGDLVFSETNARKWDMPENIQLIRELIHKP